MKLTDFALIFIAIFLPVVIIVYVNTSFVVKAEKQEMYYKNIINSAITDAVSQMKQVENEDSTIDYGYSGILDNKVSINEKVAISTFYNSLANNFNIKNNEMSIERLKMYIPVIAIMDYDGIYIHSAEENENMEVSFVTKPKVYYTYSYVIVDNGNLESHDYDIIKFDEVDLNGIKDKMLSEYIYEVSFTMDDYIYLNIYNIKQNKIGEIEESVRFYISDNNNNKDFVYGVYNILSQEKESLQTIIIEKIDDMRKRVIAETAMREISYAVNKHNYFAKQSGITYNFTFSVESDSQWYETMDGIGMIAIIQGISLGNRYLNYKAYSASDLIMAKKYYVSDGIIALDEKGNNLYPSYMSRKLYHNSEDCEIYKEYKKNSDKKIIPSFYSSKADAATQGYYPCPVCHP